MPRNVVTLRVTWFLGFASQLRKCKRRALTFASCHNAAHYSASLRNALPYFVLRLVLFFGLQYFGSGILSTKQIERLAIRTQSSRSGCIPSSSIKPCALAERQAQQVVKPYAKWGEPTLSK